MVTWRQIPGFSYEASDEGQIRATTARVRSKQGVPLKSWVVDRHGRKAAYVQLGRGNRQLVHRLVCLAFHGEPPPGSDCCHINHSSLDNRASNLRWGAHSDNVAETFTEVARERRAITLEALEVYAGPSDDCPF